MLKIDVDPCEDKGGIVGLSEICMFVFKYIIMFFYFSVEGNEHSDCWIVNLDC
jgi:hypothetical protein